MEKTNVERKEVGGQMCQGHDTDSGDVRLDLMIDQKAHRTLERLADRQGITQAAMLEKLLNNAEKWAHPENEEPFLELKNKFIKGDNVALIDAIRIALHLNKSLPAWATVKIIAALDSWRYAKYRSLDDALGVKRNKLSLKKERRIALTLWQTYGAIEDFRQNHSMSLEDAVYELARIRAPNNPDSEKACRTISRDYEMAKKLIKQSSSR